MKLTYDSGACPKCGSFNLDYDYTEQSFEDESMAIPFVCSDCGTKGEEIFSLEYLHTEMEEGE